MLPLNSNNNDNDTLLMCTLFLRCFFLSRRCCCCCCAKIIACDAISTIVDIVVILRVTRKYTPIDLFVQLFEACQKHHKKYETFFLLLISIVSWRFDSIRFDQIDHATNLLEVNKNATFGFLSSFHRTSKLIKKITRKENEISTIPDRCVWVCEMRVASFIFLTIGHFVM